MTLWKIVYRVRFIGRPEWVAAESNILTEGEDGAVAVSSLFETIMAEPHIDDRENPPVRRSVEQFQLRGLQLLGAADIIANDVIEKLGLTQEEDVPKDIRTGQRIA